MVKIKYKYCLIVWACVFLVSCSQIEQSKEITDNKILDGIWTGQFDINGRGPYDFLTMQFDGRSYAWSIRAKTLCVGEVGLVDGQYSARYRLFAMDGGPFDQAQITGDFEHDGSIASEFITQKGGDSGRIHMDTSAQYGKVTELAAMEGIWGFVDRDGLAIESSFDREGNFFASDSADCVYTGRVSPLNPEYNIYSVHLSIGECLSVNGEYAGMGFFDGDTDVLNHFKMTVIGEGYGFYFDFKQGPSSEYRPLFKDIRQL